MADKILTYLSLGSNLGDRILNLKKAEKRLQELAGPVLAVSRIYESAPWGFISDFPFYNCCMNLETSLEAPALMKLILKIEKEMGRSRTGPGYGDRLIDIDLLLYGDQIITEPGLQIPHPRMNERRFVMVPLAEIAPEVIHPVSGCSILELLDQNMDPERIKPV